MSISVFSFHFRRKMTIKYHRKNKHLLFCPPGGDMEVTIPSQSDCGREDNKTVSSIITFYCNPSAGVGIPEFQMETVRCHYLFLWHTDAVCNLM